MMLWLPACILRPVLGSYRFDNLTAGSCGSGQRGQLGQGYCWYLLADMCMVHGVCIAGHAGFSDDEPVDDLIRANMVS